jgi:hypothetical protein
MELSCRVSKAGGSASGRLELEARGVAVSETMLVELRPFAVLYASVSVMVISQRNELQLTSIFDVRVGYEADSGLCGKWRGRSCVLKGYGLDE